MCSSSGWGLWKSFLSELGESHTTVLVLVHSVEQLTVFRLADIHFAIFILIIIIIVMNDAGAVECTLHTHMHTLNGVAIFYVHEYTI